ncbi:MAG: malonyl-CoA synthase [Halieaceae bacterium]|jgi:malonyl-CoA/methylmalonyl-CoA synthetase|nr:malonyl-CoA synthase [Halieaceae bacterium]
MNDNLYAHFAQRFAGHEDRPLLVTADDRSYRFADLDRRSAQIAEVLASRGVGPGDRVSVQVDKSAENLCLYFACLRAGAVYQPLNRGYRRAELEYFIGNAEPAIVICDSSAALELQDIAEAAGTRQLLTLDADGSGSLAQAADTMPGDFAILPREAGDLAALLYSSGTTGVPKGIMLTHGNLLANGETLVEAWGFSAEDRLLHALPIFHVHGLFVAVSCVMLSGASMRWLPAYDAREVIRFLPESSVFMGVPTYYTRLLAETDFGADSCAAMRLFVSGSAPLLAETFHAFEARTGHCILERYGMTETNMNASNPLRGERRAGTVGPPLPGVEIRIVDDDGDEAPTGDIGHLQVRGPNVFAGYWRMPDKTAEDFTDDGFFNTGDLGLIDGDGYVSIVGRNKDLVITGGLNVYPKEIELFIDALPGVRESAVIGVPHVDFGEGVVAVVVRDAGAEVSEADVIAACREQLASFKTPKRVVFVDALPRNTMAKVQKNLLRESYAKLLR